MFLESLNLRKKRAIEVIKILRVATKDMTPALTHSIKKEFGHDPFLILISCLLSLRAKDVVTLPVSRELFKIAKTPQEITNIPIKKLEKIIYKIGFYKNKARTLHSVSSELIKKFNGTVPNSRKDLLSIKGVGRKTANLILGEAFNFPAICVDTHVHRVSNRLGLIKTKTVKETEKALEKLLPKEYWIEWNPLIVKWGQNICVPISPKCSECAIYNLCQRVGVKKHR